MTLTEKSLRMIELDKVLALLAREAISERAKEKCLSLDLERNLNECERLQQQTEDAQKLIGLFGSPPFSGLRDILGTLKRAEMGGALNPSELLAVASLLRGARMTRQYLNDRREIKTSLDDMFSMLTGNKHLEDSINEAIVSEEEIADNASSALYDVRRKIRQTGARVRETLGKITSSATYSKMLQEQLVTMRSGRYVVPVKSEYRGSIKGLVHDVSASGATVFIEPAAVVELNNTLRVLESEEKAEIERILYELSAETAQYAGAIERDYDILCALDFIFARGKLAYNMESVRPRLNANGKTALARARHPLLDKTKAVPIDFRLGGGCDTVIVTGPNTGGKTVSIKTLGLLTAMAQCGLHLPAAPGSEVAVFDHIFADIGDEQSIEQSLSTFSSHITNIVEITKQAGSRSLVLLDELGAGTDPVEGAALAMAIIDYFRSKGARLAATTHYAELKTYALETDGVENASCEFDIATLMPTYKLIFGIPGKSNAFAISERLGLESGIIDRARGGVDLQSKRFEEILARLEADRQAMEKKLDAANKALREAEQARELAQRRQASVESERERMLESARKQAHDLIENARKTTDDVINEARRLAKEAQDNKELNLSAARAAMRGELNEAEVKTQSAREQRRPPPLKRPLKQGDTVEIFTTKTRATVLETPEKGGPVRLQAGILKVTARQEELVLIEDVAGFAAPKGQPLENTVKLSAANVEGASRLDLRGMNADEALLELDQFLDNAVRLRLQTVTIIHGKGTGVLRQSVQAHLKKSPQVQKYRLGVFGEGETGVTIAELRI